MKPDLRFDFTADKTQGVLTVAREFDYEVPDAFGDLVRVGTENRTRSPSTPSRSMRANQLEKMSSPTSVRSRFFTRDQRS